MSMAKRDADGATRPGDGPVRVLWVIKGLGPGGAEHLLLSGARAHDREAFDFEVAYLLPWKDTLAADLEKEDVATHCLGVRDVRDLRWLARFRRLASSGAFDMVHAHSPFVAAGVRLVLRTIPRRKRPRLVVTEHNAWLSYRWGTRAVTAATMRLDDAHIAVSDQVSESLPRRLRPGVRTIVHGIVVDEVRALRSEHDEVRAELGLGPDDIVVGTVANLRAQKAYPDLLHAARAVIDERPDVRFVAVGQGPLEEEIRALHRRLELGDRFQLLGFRPDARRVLAGCDIFALSSVYEGYPIAVMEALAVGLPIVATAVGGVPAAVRNGKEGLIVPPGNPAALAAGILELVADPDRRAAMAEAATERGFAYDITTSVRSIEDVYRDVLRSAPS